MVFLTLFLQLFKLEDCQSGMRPIKPLSALLLGIVLLSSSCIHRTYFLSPLQANTSAYHAIPVRSDSIKSAFYTDLAFSGGGMNESWRDGVYSFRAGIHRSHVLENMRLYYGASFIAGDYHVNDLNNVYNGSGSTNYNQSIGNKFYGAAGLNGGLSFTAPLGHYGEWRFIGVEGSFFHEFGDYYQFRKSLPDSAADIIERNQNMGSLGLSTELIFKGRSANQFGIKIAGGSYLHQLHSHTSPNNYYSRTYDLAYFSNTYHFTVRKVTAYFQINLGTKSGHFQAGLNYRLK